METLNLGDLLPPGGIASSGLVVLLFECPRRWFDSTLLVNMFLKAHPVFLVTQRMLRVVMGYAERQVPAGNMR